jgi:hypothetical protein
MDKVLPLKEALQEIPDPRSKQGISHPFHGILALVLLGIIARQIYMSHIAEWAKIYWHELKEPLGFDSENPPDRLHLMKDRWWDEDIHALFRPGLGEIWSSLTSLAVSLLWWGGEKGKSLPKRARAVEHQPLQCLKNFGY